jgi:hypothetical protein
MGVKTALVGITFTAGDYTQAAAIGLDLNDFVLGIELTCQEITQKLNFLKSDILTPASDAGNATTLTTQITALS